MPFGKRVPPPTKSLTIARTLEREIRSGRMAKGHRLESEAALVRRFRVSRNTVRKGLEVLARAGLIATHSGVGSFVTYDGTPIDDRLGWTRALSESAEPAETRVLRIDRAGDPAAATALGTADDFLCVDRLRVVPGGDVAISLERSRAPWRDAFTAVLTEGLTRGSLSRTLAAANLVPSQGEEWAAVLPSLGEDDARLMGRPAGSAMLHLTRVARDAEGRPVEYVESLLDPARFRLHLRFGL